MVAGKSHQDQLPPGFSEKVKVSNGRKIKIYTEISTGSAFYSRPAITRYLESLGFSSSSRDKYEPEKMVESHPEQANQTSIEDEERKEASSAPDNMVKSELEPSSRGSLTSNPQGKRKETYFTKVAMEKKEADALPSDWTKEIKITKSGNKIRKDPFYKDPVSGYMFRSFPDALRYLKTNDIRNCACKPLRRQLDDVRSTENNFPSTPVNEKLSWPLETGAQDSSAKVVESDIKVLKETQEEDVKGDDLSSFGVVNPQNPDESSEKNTRSRIEKQTSTPQTEKQKSKRRQDSTLPSRSSKRIRGGAPELPSGSELNERALRLAVRRSSAHEANASPSTHPASDGEPAQDTAQNAVVDEETRNSSGDKVDEWCSLSSTASAASVPGSDVVPAKDTKEMRDSSGEKVDTSPNGPVIVPADTVIPPSRIEEPKDSREHVYVSGETLQENAPSIENQAIPEEQKGGEPVEKQPDDGRIPESQPGYAFGDAWSDDPCLEFAFKTLTGQLPIDDTFAFPNLFGDPLGNPFNQVDNGSFGSSLEANVPNIFQTDAPSRPEPSKQQQGNGAVDSLQANSSPANNSSMAPLGSSGYPTCNGFSSQQSGGDIKKNDYQTKVRS